MAEKKKSTTATGKTAKTSSAKKSNGNSSSAAKSGTAKAQAGGGGGANAKKEKSQSEIIRHLAEKSDLPQAKIRAVLEAQAELLVAELRSTGSVPLYNLGKLKTGQRGERQGRNPATGEPITIKASKTFKFAGGKRFKDQFQ